MANSVKKHEFFLPFVRVFTHGHDDAFESIPFQESESFGDESFPPIAAPIAWEDEAVSVMAEAAHRAVPADLRANEENTVPSWLWRHKSHGLRREAEADLRDVFNRVVGSATAKAWKLGLFTSERHARIFYDETRFALMQRHIAVVPEVLASWGLSWAYGLEETPKRSLPAGRQSQQAVLSNASIDALMDKPKNSSVASLWKKLFTTHGKEVQSVSLRLSDISADWHSSPNPARAAINLLALRRDDGSIHIDALCQSARILTILLDLQDRHDVTIGMANLSPLLMGLGLAYDSEAARAMASSLMALVTAECAAASAELASLRGMSDDFTANREDVMRALRNHRRAAYGDDNDYEKLSVLPAPLPLKNCPDLSLAAEAQRRWDDALDLARAFGLRATQMTDLTPSPVLAVILASPAQGIAPLNTLTVLKPDEAGSFGTGLHPSVREAFVRMGYAKNVVAATATHIAGSGSLLKAPSINARSLKARGLDDVAIEKVEAYLPCVTSVRFALTPWIVGVDFCLGTLKVPEDKLDNPTFSLLHHLGFSDGEIEAADRFCYGFGTARNAKSIPIGHRALFACGDEVSVEARLRMAAAVQSFVSGDTGVTVRLPASQSVECGAETALSAWSLGLKSLTLVFDLAMTAKPVLKIVSHRVKGSAKAPEKAVVSLHSKPKARRQTSIVSAKKANASRRGLR